MLKTALNALTRLHSRQATLKRLGSPDIFSPVRITPSNYFRFLGGPEYTTIRGVEFILPLDSMLGQFAQKLVFSSIPVSGQFKLSFGMNTTAAINYDASAADIQAALRLISPLSAVVVTGSFLLGFTITFVSFSTSTGTGQVVDNTLQDSTDPVTGALSQTNTLWADPIKKGDRILDGNRIWSVDEIMEMHDLGAQVMAYRCRCD